ncbi:hypothetical protein ACSQ67_022038 [Phaseolus vulgaris]
MVVWCSVVVGSKTDLGNDGLVWKMVWDVGIASGGVLGVLQIISRTCVMLVLCSLRYWDCIKDFAGGSSFGVKEEGWKFAQKVIE